MQYGELNAGNRPPQFADYIPGTAIDGSELEGFGRRCRLSGWSANICPYNQIVTRFRRCLPCRSSSPGNPENRYDPCQGRGRTAATSDIDRRDWNRNRSLLHRHYKWSNYTPNGRSAT